MNSLILVSGIAYNKFFRDFLEYFLSFIGIIAFVFNSIHWSLVHSCYQAWITKGILTSIKIKNKMY